jgi:hypothetical protein
MKEGVASESGAKLRRCALEGDYKLPRVAGRIVKDAADRETATPNARIALLPATAPTTKAVQETAWATASVADFRPRTNSLSVCPRPKSAPVMKLLPTSAPSMT